MHGGSCPFPQRCRPRRNPSEYWKIRGHDLVPASEDIDVPRRLLATPFGSTTAFSLRFRDVGDLPAERGITVSYEAIRLWCLKCGPGYARTLKRHQGRLGDTWRLDELFVTIRRRRHYLWRAVDQNGDVLDILVQPRRDRCTAERFFRKLLRGQGTEPRRLVTDKLRSYAAAHRAVMPSVVHSIARYENDRAEVSHQPTRQRGPQMRRLKSPVQAQRFLSVQGIVGNLFRIGRHLLLTANYRMFRARAFVFWQQVSCA